MQTTIANTPGSSSLIQVHPDMLQAGRKKGIGFYLLPDAVKKLHTIGMKEYRALQTLMIETVNMLFKSRGNEIIK